MDSSLRDDISDLWYRVCDNDIATLSQVTDM